MRIRRLPRGVAPGGGAIGLLFYVAYSISCAFYTIGVADELKAIFWPQSTSAVLSLQLCSATLACLQRADSLHPHLSHLLLARGVLVRHAGAARLAFAAVWPEENCAARRRDAGRASLT